MVALTSTRTFFAFSLFAAVFAASLAQAQERAPHPCTPDAAMLGGLAPAEVTEDDRTICRDYVTQGKTIVHGYGRAVAFQYTDGVNQYGDRAKRRKEWGTEVIDPAMGAAFADGKQKCEAKAAALGKPATACHQMMSLVLASDSERGLVFGSFWFID